MLILNRQSRPITLIGGGRIGAADLSQALELGSVCAAADGGAIFALEAGITPEIVIGDLDSISTEVRAQIPPSGIHQIAEQDSTDFDKCLRVLQAPVIIGVGFCGGRVDHQLAAMHSLVAHAHQQCVLISDTEIIFHCPAHLALPLSEGDVVSLFPMRPMSGRSDGLKWPIEGLVFDPFSQIGTSNAALGFVELWMEQPGMLCILPRKYLKVVVDLLQNLSKLEKWT